MNIRTDILLRVYIAFGLIVLLAFAVLFKLFHVQLVQGEKWRAMADSLSTRFVNVEAARGNIYSVDGSLLATSVPEYELHMDMLAGGIEKNEIFISHKIFSIIFHFSKNQLYFPKFFSLSLFLSLYDQKKSNKIQNEI